MCLFTSLLACFVGAASEAIPQDRSPFCDQLRSIFREQAARSDALVGQVQNRDDDSGLFTSTVHVGNAEECVIWYPDTTNFTVECTFVPIIQSLEGAVDLATYLGQSTKRCSMFGLIIDQYAPIHGKLPPGTWWFGSGQKGDGRSIRISVGGTEHNKDIHGSFWIVSYEVMTHVEPLIER